MGNDARSHYSLVFPCSFRRSDLERLATLYFGPLACLALPIADASECVLIFAFKKESKLLQGIIQGALPPIALAVLMALLPIVLRCRTPRSLCI